LFRYYLETCVLERVVAKLAFIAGRRAEGVQESVNILNKVFKRGVSGGGAEKCNWIPSKAISSVETKRIGVTLIVSSELFKNSNCAKQQQLRA
jgi:hypothetical protein